MVEREGFEPSKAKAARFTVWSRWPLGYLSNNKLGREPLDIIRGDDPGKREPRIRNAERGIRNSGQCLVSVPGNTAGARSEESLQSAFGVMELETGLEPVTYGLQNRCSTN